MFVDPRTNLGLEIKYDTRDTLYPAPLTGGFTWDNKDTARGVQDLADHAKAYYRVNSFFPKKVYMSFDLITDLMSQESTSAMAVSMGLISHHDTSTLPKRVTRRVLKLMAEENKDIPEICEWDAQYELETEPGKNTSARYLPENTYTFIQPKAVDRSYGLTVESAMGLSNAFGKKFRTSGSGAKGGILVRAKKDDLDCSPPKSEIFGVGRMIPFCHDARRLGARQVKGAA